MINFMPYTGFGVCLVHDLLFLSQISNILDPMAHAQTSKIQLTGEVTPNSKNLLYLPNYKLFVHMCFFSFCYLPICSVIVGSHQKFEV